ncbi:methylitaconate delta-isomerase [Pseudohyphozyma bogoriensis]|nr:methylitaconate delta-isomerase [Pseudohyphozyma bogoriensis]
MPQYGIAASFWRGGTSRGLIFRANAMAILPSAVRDKVILAAMGSPDPDGRQISGLGGGVSSLSKAAIIGLPGEGLEDQKTNGRLPGCEWADDESRRGEYDLVYRFAQVGVRDSTVDWSATCGNMLGAVAHAAISSHILPYSTLFTRSRLGGLSALSDETKPFMFPLKILSASNSQIIYARVPLDPISLEIFQPPDGEGFKLAGVPGEGAAIELEFPIGFESGGEGGLVTGRARDLIHLDGHDPIPVSVITAGLPNVFVNVTSLSLPPDLLAAPAPVLTAHPALPLLLESLRQAAASQFNIPISLASPKITLVGPVPPEGYASSSAREIMRGEVMIPEKLFY